MIDLVSVLLAAFAALSVSPSGPVPAVDAADYVEHGLATWYCGSTATCTKGYGPSDLIAAIDRKDSRFRIGDVVVVGFDDRTVAVRIVDVCACGGERIIDLSRGAFARLADPSFGVIRVTLFETHEQDAAPTAPPTDTARTAQSPHYPQSGRPILPRMP